MSNNLDISVLIATYNRAAFLRQTLENMMRLDRDGLSVEIVVVDNNSSDRTREVVEFFSDRLPVRYLFEPRPGKNCALNKALAEVTLGRIVAFTDDDVKPQKDWFKAMLSVCERWPEYSAFGGKINVIWPNVDVPAWAEVQDIKNFGYAYHVYADGECQYAPRDTPFGPNCWVRCEVFSGNRRFNEDIGPCPKTKIMGSEVSFLLKLYQDGYRMLYSPHAVVGHCIQPEFLTEDYIKKKAIASGRCPVHVRGLEPASLFSMHPHLWRLYRTAALARSCILYLRSLSSFSHDRRIERQVDAIRRIAYNIESLRVAKKMRNSR